MLGRQISDYVLVPAGEVVAAFEPDTDDLSAVAGVTPSVMSEIGVEPEVKILGIKRTVDDSVKLLADEEPRDGLRLIRVDGSRHQRVGPVCTNDLASAILNGFAATARGDDDVVAVVLKADEGGLVMDFCAASLYRPMIGILAVQMGRGSAEKIHWHGDHAGKVKRDSAAGGRFVKYLGRQRPEILDQETVPARRKNTAAYLVTWQCLALDDDGLEACIDQALGGCSAGETGTHDNHIHVAHQDASFAS